MKGIKTSEDEKSGYREAQDKPRLGSKNRAILYFATTFQRIIATGIRIAILSQADTSTPVVK